MIFVCLLCSESSFSSPQGYELLEGRDSVCVLKPGIRADISWAFYRDWMNEACLHGVCVNKDRKEIIRNNHTGGWVCSYNQYLSVSHVPCIVLDSDNIPSSYPRGYFW